MQCTVRCPVELASSLKMCDCCLIDMRREPHLHGLTKEPAWKCRAMRRNLVRTYASTTTPSVADTQLQSSYRYPFYKLPYPTALLWSIAYTQLYADPLARSSSAESTVKEPSAMVWQVGIFVPVLKRLVADADPEVQPCEARHSASQVRSVCPYQRSFRVKCQLHRSGWNGRKIIMSTIDIALYISIL